MLSLLFALAACTTIDHSELISATNELPEIDGDCLPDDDDIELEDGTRVVSRVAPDGDTCRAEVYARTTLVEWDEVNVDAPSPLGAIRTEWVSAEGEFTALAVKTATGDVAPVGTRVAVAQLLSTDSEGQPKFDEDPTILLDTFAAEGLGEYPEHLLGFEYALKGGEEDLVDVIDVVQDGGPADIMNASFDVDPVLYLLTVASVAVPLSTLDELGATEIRLNVEEEIRFEANVHYKLFGKEE